MNNKRILGIDEAGRGCVLGPLAVGGFLICEHSQDALRAAGADDSKRLSKKKRDQIRLKLADLGTADVRLISAKAIDGANLNELEMQAIVLLVNRFEPDVVYIDALGHPQTLPALARKLDQTVAPSGIEWIIEPKADQRYPVVGAASIFAKTTRDSELEAHKAQWGDFGSGYPSDPKTRRWLEKIAAKQAAWPPFVRTRWGTVRALSQRALL